MRPVEAEAERFFDLLENPVTGLRAIRREKDKPLAVGVFKDSRDFADAACGLSGAGEGPDLYQGVFTTVNRLNDEYVEMATGLIATGQTVREKGVARIKILPLDLDPIRDHPEGGRVCSTEAEHQAAIDAANRAATIGRSLGWADPMVLDSGNGGYCFWRVDLPNTPESRALVKAVIQAFKKQLDSDAVKVDGSVDDPSRVFRIPGTINRKSPPTQDRPNRLVRILSAPQRLTAVSLEQLQALAGEYVVPPTIEPKHKELLPAEVHEQRVEAVSAWMTKAGYPPRKREDKTDFTVLAFPHCPIRGAKHDDGDSAILVYRTGGRGYKCFHETVCPTKTFADLERLFKAKFEDVASEFATGEVYGSSDRVFNDPLLLAKTHLGKWKMPDGTHTLAFICGDTWRFDLALGWVPVKPGELEPWIRETAQEIFDQHAKILSRITDFHHKPKPIRGQLVPDTYKAMQSLCKRQVLHTAQSPYWLEPYKDWDAEDLLVFKNGILNVRRYIEQGTDYLIPVTPKLFFEHRANFDFDPQAAYEPAHLLQFLASLDRDQNWDTFLQEIFGYCLWQKYDLQKFFVLVGPPRCGKGTINGVLENLVGGKSSVCALNIKDFADQFGLEPAIAKRLAFVPEMRMPGGAVHEIVSNLKAITGGDLIQVKRKTIKNLSMRLRIKIIMSTNEFVPLPDNSGALQARMLPLRFTKSFVGREDTRLAEKLAGEYPAILLWALEGLKRLWQNAGQFTLPRSTIEELQQIVEASAPLQAFVEECCVIDQSRACQSPSLYEIYRVWRNEFQAETEELKNNQFAEALRSTIPSVTKGRMTRPRDTHCKERRIVATRFDGNNRAECWLGVAPKPEWAQWSGKAA